MMLSKNNLLKEMPWILILTFVFNLGAASNAIARARFQDFTLNSTAGESHKLSQYQGKNPVLLVFFATWCPPCNREVPHLVELQKKYGDKGLKILAVDIDEPRDLVNEFIKEKGINYTVLLDEGGQVAETYNVSGIPTNILFDKKGDVRYAGHALPRHIEDVL